MGFLVMCFASCCVLLCSMIDLSGADYVYAPVTDAMRANAQTIIQNATAPGNTWVFDHLAQLTDDYGPRFSGSASLEAALDWIVAAATADGGNGRYYNVSTETVMVPAWIRGNEWASWSSPTRNKTLHMVGLGMSNNTNGKVITAPVLVVKSKEELDARGAEAVGKVVVFNAAFVTYGETVTYRVNAATWAAAAGGVAALIRSVAPYSMQNPHTGGSATAPVPSAAISVEDATQLQRLFDRNVPVEVSLYMEMHQVADRPSRNVIMDIQGTTKPDEFVVFGGHSDSWDIAEGAMDDGGGIISAWGAISLIGRSGIRVARTLRAVMWVNEENGDRGGEKYAIDHAAELNKTSIAYETDEGAFSPYTFSFSGHGAAFNQLSILKELLYPLGAANVSLGGGGTDIDPMCSQGVPCASLPPRDPRATNFSNNPCSFVLSAADYATPGLGDINSIPPGYFWFHHSDADTVDRMDPRQLQTFAAVLGVWAIAIGDLPELLPRSGSVPPLPPVSTPAPASPSAASSDDFVSKMAPPFFVGVGCAVALAAVVYYFFLRGRRVNERQLTDGVDYRELEK